MTQEDKELLLKDLSARLPYKLICEVEYKEGGRYKTSNMFLSGVFIDEAYFTSKKGSIYSNGYKPYLLPLSSMTEEQMFDFATVQSENCKGSYPTLSECSAIIDWGYKHHFDVNSLIEKGLALDATGLNIY